MASTTLVEDDIEKGREVLKALDDEGLKVRSAFWLFQPNSSDWRLRLTVPNVDKVGARSVYENIQRVLAKKDLKLTVWTIQVVGSSDELSKRLRSIVKTKPQAVDGIRFSHNSIDDTYIEDAYIYRSA